MPGTGAPGRERLIRDPIYGYIRVPFLVEPVLGHPFVQRLRRIGQTSLTNLVYPSLTHTRFEHSLGTMHLGRRACLAALTNAGAAQSKPLDALFGAIAADGIELRTYQQEEFIADAVAAAGLLHDVGHPPMSHILEDDFLDRLADLVTVDDLPFKWNRLEQVKGPFHEVAGEVLVDQLFADLKGRWHNAPGFPSLVKEIYHADPDQPTWAGALHSIIASEVDVDRLDYLMRDGQRAGTEFGAIDYQRLVDSYGLLVQGSTEFRIAAGTRARSAVETMLVQRMQSYRWILFHHRVVGGNLALTSALAVLKELQRSTDLAGTLFEGDDTRAWELFRRTALPMNYVAPKAGDLKEAVFAATEVRTHLDDQGDDELHALVRSSQTRIDDVALFHALEQAQLVSQAVLRSPGAAPKVVSLCEDFLLYCSSILQRSRQYWSAWKTVEEWASAAHEMWDSGALPDALEAMWRQLESEAEDAPPLVPVIARARAALDQRDGAVAKTNFIVDQLLVHPRYRQELETMLATQQTPLQHGRWRVAHAAFQPIRDDMPSILFRDDKRVATPLSSESPMVEALRQVDAARVRLAVFFFASHPPGAIDQRELAPGVLVGRIATTLPEFFRVTWAAHLRGLAEVASG